MGFISFVFDALTYIIGFLYPSFSLYTYLVFSKEKPRLIHRLLKILEHYVVMVFLMCFEYPLDVLFGGAILSILKFTFVYFLCRNRFDLSHQIANIFILKITNTSPYLIEIAEKSHILSFFKTFILTVTTITQVFNEQYEEILSEIDYVESQ